MTSYEQNRVSRAVWPWASPPGSTPPPQGMSPRRKVLITTPIALLIAYGMYRWKHHLAAPAAITVVALSICFCGLFVPPAFAAIERGFARFGALVGTLLTWLLLTPTFYLIFAGGHLLLWMSRKDPLNRACPSREPTYWVDRPPVTRKNYYLSQH